MTPEQAINQFVVYIDSDYDNKYIPTHDAILKAYGALKSQKSLVDYMNFLALNGDLPTFQNKRIKL